MLFVNRNLKALKDLSQQLQAQNQRLEISLKTIQTEHGRVYERYETLFMMLAEVELTGAQRALLQDIHQSLTETWNREDQLQNRLWANAVAMVRLNSAIAHEPERYWWPKPINSTVIQIQRTLEIWLLKTKIEFLD